MEIKQSSTFLLDLLRHVANGKLVPAAMQRPYVWKKEDVEALCDSLLSGFPIGSFLIWAPGPKADLSQLGKGRLGPIIPESTESSYDSGLLLDGQNRLASLAWMVLQEIPWDIDGTSEEERSTWLSGESLVLDGATQSMKFVPAAEASVGLRMPAWTLMSTLSKGSFHSGMELIRIRMKDQWAGYCQDDVDQFLKFWDNCCSLFREARVTETTIQRATVEEARHAFIRICRVGVPMSQADFDAAIGWEAK